MWRNWSPSALLVGRKSGSALWKTVWWFFRKLNIKLPHDPAIPLIAIYLNISLRYIKKQVLTNTHTNVYSSTNHNSQKAETMQISINKQIKKLWYVCVYIYIRVCVCVCFWCLI